MQELTDLRRQAAATALAPLGISTSWENVFAGQVEWTGRAVAAARTKLDVRNLYPIQDFDPTSGTFGKLSQVFLDEQGLLDPFNAGPI